MRRIKLPAYFGPLSFSMFLLGSMASTHALHAQNAPASGTSVVVRMIDAVDSGSDSAGKQYRASVTKPVDAGNGVAIAQGAAATVTLASSGSGWTAQLTSVTINGQAVAVTSSSASVTSSAQTAASNAANAVGSMLGHRANVPAGVTAVAMGQRVVLPPGTTLTFVVSQPPSSNTATPASAASPGQPVTAPAPPAGNPASSPASSPAAASASGQMGYWLCRYRDLKDTLKPALGSMMYVTPFLHTSGAKLGERFNTFIVTTYDVRKDGNDYFKGYCRQVSESADQRALTMETLEKQWASDKVEVIHVNWTDTPAENAAINAKAASATTAAAASAAAVAPTASANEYYVVCASGRAGPVVYYSDIFAAAPPPGTQPIRTKSGPLVMFPTGFFQTPFFAFLQNKYGFKSDSNYPVECGANFPPTTAGFQQAQTYKQSLQDIARQNKAQIVETGWKNQ